MILGDCIPSHFFLAPSIRECIAGKLRQEDPETGGSAIPGKRHPLVVVRNTAAATPNLTLNVDNQVARGELYAVAAMGVVLQSAVLVYCGLITRYFMVAGYAFPCTAIGTLLLVTGMLLCATLSRAARRK
jgi:hypothetical protein